MFRERFVDAVAIGLMTAGLLFGLAVWSALPAELVIHWGPGNVPDTTVQKPLAVFGLYAFGVGVVAFTRLAPDSMTNTPGGKNATVLFVGVVFAWIQTIVVAWNLGFDFDVGLAILPILVVAGLLVLVARRQ